MRHLLITGASGGIGREAVHELASSFSHMTLLGRDPDRYRPVLDALGGRGVDAQLVDCDLASLTQVAAAAARVRPRGPIDVVIANAGLAGQRGVTEDGFETHFGVNHLAHHLLVTELADHITERVVIVSSNAHYDVDDVDLARVTRRTASLTGIREYRRSKLANALDGRRLAELFEFDTYILHPGLVATDIWRRLPWPVRSLVTRRMATPAEGGQEVAWAATATGLESGGYYAYRTLRPPSVAALDEDTARELWDRSEAWVAPFRRRSG